MPATVPAPATRRAAPPWWRSFVFAAAGLHRAYASERNLRVQAAAGWAVLGGALLVGLPATDVGLLGVTIGAVLGMEAMNSAIEVTVDLVSPEPHPLARAAKDLGAGAVLAVSLGALAAGLGVFAPLGRLPHALWLGVRREPVLAAAWLAGLLAGSPLARRRPQ